MNLFKKDDEDRPVEVDKELLEVIVIEDDNEADRDPIDRVLDEVREINFRKRADYAQDGDPFSNFRDTAYQLGLTAGHAVETHIATKQSRLRQLLFTDRDVNNESVRDTLLDRAVYSLIALALFDDGSYSSDDGDKNDDDSW